MRASIPLHGLTDHRANGPDPIAVLIHLLCFREDVAGTTGDDARRFTVTPDLGGAVLRSANASHAEDGGSDTEIQIHNIDTGDDLLTDLIVIDAGDTNSWISSSPSRVDQSGAPAVNRVSLGDRLRVDVDAWGSGALGLVVHLEFGPPIIRLS